MGNNEWLDIDVLDDYLEGKLDAGTMHKIERISLEDPFVAQALAGLAEAKKRTYTLSILQKQLQERVAEKPIERKMWRITSHRLSIAATAAVLFVTVSVLFWMRENHRQQQAEIAANKNKQIEVDLKPEATAVAPIDTLAPAVSEMKLDQQKAKAAVNQTLVGGNQAVAKNKSDVNTGFKPAAILQNKQMVAAKLKKETRIQQGLVAEPSSKVIPPPVQALQSKVEGIQVQTSNAKTVRGIVLDINGRPIPGADVKMVGNDIRAITNVSGEFTLSVDKAGEKVDLEVASIGYARKNIEAKANQDVSVQLVPNNNALNEVVVAYGNSRTKTPLATDTNVAIGNASVLAKKLGISNFNSPKDGWAAYEKYLAKENKFFAKGNLPVQLTFSISKDGRPVDIMVVEGQNKELDNEAIRLVKEGPQWNYKPNSANRGGIIIQF